MNELNIDQALVGKRKEKGITQDELASYIGVSKAAVSKWETGQSYPDIVFLPQLAAYFDMTVDTLLGYAPQMTKEAIGKLYHRLCKDFTNKPFDDVANEIREIIKKYYSCAPLILHMGILMINHHDVVDASKRESLITEALEIFVRIQGMGTTLEICHQAKSMEAVCYIMLNQPARVVDLLQDSHAALVDDTTLLAQGQMMCGQMREARETLQIGAYQTLGALLSTLTALLQSADAAQAREIDRRLLAIAKVFELETLSPAIMLSVYLTEAQCYLTHGDEEATMVALQKYVNLATSKIYPLTLHGDAFFDQIDRWLAESTLGKDAPRTEVIVKAGLVAAVRDNPLFAPLQARVQYKFLVEKLGLLAQ